jgi:hypothetical protein
MPLTMRRAQYHKVGSLHVKLFMVGLLVVNHVWCRLIVRDFRNDRSTNVSVAPLRSGHASPRSHPRTVLMSLVLVLTSASRIPHIDFHSLDCFAGMCTDGKSIRQDASLNSRASL